MVLSAAAMPAQDVSARVSGAELRVAAPNLHFVTGKPLESLRNGASVTFDIQVSILADGKSTVLRRSFERFVVSFDVWQERFSVLRMRTDRASASNLTAAGVEQWCLDRFTFATTGLPENKPFTLRVDVRAQNSRERREEEGDGLSLYALVDLFSRTARPNGPMQWRADSTPTTLDALRRMAR